MTDTQREFQELMLKNKERGLLNFNALNRLKRLGFNIFDDDTIVSEEKKAGKKTGRMSVDASMVAYQRKNERAYSDSSWKPKSLLTHTDEFFHWINSMLEGSFPEKLYYEPFERYKAQAQYWLDQKSDPYDYLDKEARKEAVLEEYERIDRNTLYYAAKYGMFVDGSRREGKANYVPKEHNAVIFYLLDCGYCMMLGKPRQIFMTTTIGIYVMKKLLTQENFYMKYITMDIDTGMEIMNDKIKPVLALNPLYLRPQAARDYNKGLRLGRKISKGSYATPNSRVEVVAPTKTAINGGSPSVVLVDEIAAIPNLIPMILEARPTMYIDVNQDGLLQLIRQLILFGTGVSDMRGKENFSILWEGTLELWNKKEYKSALFVPIFFSWHTRCSKEVYDQEQKTYYSGNIDELKEFSLEERKQIFHMHYPSHWRDMFGAASNKLVSRDLIEKGKSRIKNLPASQKPIYGYFEPVYDYTKKYDDDNYLPATHKVIGANFIAYDDRDGDTSKITAQVYVFPDKKCKNRFWKGTDPVQTDTGQSNFASVIWDEEKKMPACVLNFRKSYDHKAAYFQSLLMAIYYDPRPSGEKRGVPELLENNIGGGYKIFCELLGYGKNFVYNKELPKDLQGGGAVWGFNCHGSRKNSSVSQLAECVNHYSDNFMFSVIFDQLDTYAPKQIATGVSWSPIDTKLFRDDVLDALAYAYICRKSFPNKMPENDETATSEKIIKFRYVEQRMPDGTLTRVPQRVTSKA